MARQFAGHGHLSLLHGSGSDHIDPSAAAGLGTDRSVAKGLLRILAGHVLCQRAEQAIWWHERAVHRELLLLAAMLSSVGDVETLHTELKKANNERSRLARELDDLRARERSTMLEPAVADLAPGGRGIALCKSA